jgi:phage terminase large subunit-like protein
MLSKKYIRAECAKYPPGSRGRDEELEGKVFAEAAGAFWKDEWINRSRRMVAPELDLVIVIIDPAQSTNDDADDTGISVVGRGAIDRHAYVLRDASGKHAPEAWADIAVSECELRSSGVIIERNKIGDAALSVLRSRAKEKGFSIVSLKEEEPFPKRREKIIFVREVVAQDSKSTRAAGPASETELGFVHLVGDDFTALELELTTFEPDGRKSPNRLDAMVYGVEEIRGLARNTPSTTAAEDAAGALAAHTTLRTMLPRIDGRRVGL